VRTNEELEIEAPMRLWEQRIGAVLSALRAVDAKTVDLGCGEGKLLKPLLQDKSFERLVGMDVSWRSLETAHRRLYMDQMPDAQRKRIELMHGSLMYRDKRLEGFDAASVKLTQAEPAAPVPSSE
jgi:predicted TPR repeat methyltransferase